jgi:hypothetical protein
LFTSQSFYYIITLSYFLWLLFFCFSPKSDDLLNLFAEQKTPFIRATWYIKIFYLNTFYNPSHAPQKVHFLTQE